MGALADRVGQTSSAGCKENVRMIEERARENPRLR
jgi:hypothetical protein